MRLIDADALPKYTGYALSADEVATAVENAPTIDAVPVVRCKDCKYYKTGMFCEKWADLHPHAEEYPMVCSDGYCHYGAKMDGKRKDGSEDG